MCSSPVRESSFDFIEGLQQSLYLWKDETRVTILFGIVARILLDLLRYSALLLERVGVREPQQAKKMLLPCRLSFATCTVATNEAPVSVLNRTRAESLPMRAATRRSLIGRTGDARVIVQALLPLSSPKNVAGGISACHSSFRTGLSLGRSVQSSNGSRWSAMWLDNTALVETDVPISVAWDLWSDREGVSRWMPWIDNVKVLEDQPDLSRWTLKYAYFGRDWEFSWLSRNMKPTFHQKIHWRSVEGIPNRGTVRFYPRGSTSCAVQLTISYEVPQVLGAVGMALAPIVENILQQDLNRFAKFAKNYQLESQRK